MTLNHETTKPGRKTVAQKIGLCLTPEQRAKGCLLLRIKSPELNARFTRKLYSGFIGADATPFAKAVLAVPGLGYKLNRVDVGIGKVLTPVLRHYARKAHELIVRYRQQMDKSPMVDIEKVDGRDSTSLSVDQYLVAALSQSTDKKELSQYMQAARQFVKVCTDELADHHPIISRLGPLRIPTIALIAFLLTKYYAYSTGDPALSSDCTGCSDCFNPWYG